MNLTELRLHRKNTSAFIAQDPVVLQLIPQVKVRTSDGGYRTDDGVPRREQIFRLIPQSASGGETTLTSGQVAPVVYVLLGEWDAEIGRDDTFVLNNTKYRLSGPIRPEHTGRAYERKAEVVRDG